MPRPRIDPAAMIEQLRARAAVWMRARRPWVAAAVMVAVAGTGLTALAVAPLAALSTLAPDPAALPRRTVSETLPLPALAGQVQALAEQDLELVRGTVSHYTDSAEALLSRLGAGDAEAADFLRRDAAAARHLHGRGGRLVRARVDGTGRVLELSARFPATEAARRGTHFGRLVVRRQADGTFVSQVHEAPFELQLRLAAGTITTSLFAATDAADVPDAVAVQLAEIFAVDIDFHRELRRGDRFVVVYEVRSADGEPVPWNEGSGRVLATEFTNAGRTHSAVWYAGPGAADGGAYYGPDGSSRRREFLASPLEFTRISSGFAMRRDPINGRWRAHRGVDYAAPTGTPVRALGDGKVASAGWMGGYGRAVTVDHGGGRLTLYAHLSRIGVKPGERVQQGQVVGAVGSTGWATGPHLHFEFRVRGAHQDPLAIARRATAVPLAPQALAQFMAQRGPVLEKLALAASLVDDAAPVAETAAR
ncbi:MAG: M23 family metallopeptidase [Rubrivivax sp.]|nr:M23 family metallopeptidase [Rubrivivax sp.]